MQMMYERGNSVKLNKTRAYNAKNFNVKKYIYETKIFSHINYPKRSTSNYTNAN